MGLTRRRWVLFAVGAELLVAAGCVFAGLQAARPASSVGLVSLPRVARAAAPAVDAPPPALALPTPAPRVAPSWPALGAGLLDRLSHDDYSLYTKQWQVISVLMAGIRHYIEQRLVPAIKASDH